VEGIDCVGIRALLLDIEGTTTPLAFVTRVLFPYAHAHVAAWLQAHGGEPAVRADLEALRAEHARDTRPGVAPRSWEETLESAVAYVHFLMAADDKSTALKALQGRIWESGFRSGALRGAVYPDVPPALSRWRRQARQVAIFSSGSTLAQELLFANSTAGDLTGHLAGYFDTTTGPKRKPESYRRIAEALGARPPEVLFLSDVVEELDAAREAGMRTALCVREGEAPASSGNALVHTFDGVCPDPS
jgi:enolase-phosphatase E1